MRRSRREGWTKIEFGVVVVLGLTVLGLVAVLLQHFRGPAHRVECGMHIKLMGEAFQAFHDQHKSLPASCIAPGYATWAVQIAPYVKQDQGKTLKTWDMEMPYYSQTPTVREAQLSIYYCPARRAPGLISTIGDVAPGAGLIANVAGALGDYGCAPTSDNTAKPWISPEADGALIAGEILDMQGDKIIRWKSQTTLASLQRGLGQTILLGEKHVRVGEFGQTQFGDGSLYNGGYPASFARIVDASHALAKEPTDPFNLNFGSWHPGICQFLMADGSLQAFSNDVNPALLQKLIPRALPP